MNEHFPEPLSQYWFYEVIPDVDFQELLIMNDIVHVLQACGFSEELAIDKAFEIFLSIELFRILE